MRRLLPLLASLVLLALPSAAPPTRSMNGARPDVRPGSPSRARGRLTVTFKARVGQIGLGGVQCRPQSIAGGTSAHEARGRPGRRQPVVGRSVHPQGRPHRSGLRTVAARAGLRTATPRIWSAANNRCGSWSPTSGRARLHHAGGHGDAEDVQAGASGGDRAWQRRRALVHRHGREQDRAAGASATCGAAITPVVDFDLPPASGRPTSRPRRRATTLRRGPRVCGYATAAGLTDAPIDIGTARPVRPALQRLGRVVGGDRPAHRPLHQRRDDRVGAAARLRHADRLHAGLRQLALVHGHRRRDRALLGGDRRAGPTGPHGPDRPTGPPARTGRPGATGAPAPRAPPARRAPRARRARTGAAGCDGRPRRDGPSARPARPGPPGRRAPAARRGATGATGPAGPRGKTGAAAKIPKITCKLSGSKVTCKVGASSGGSGGSGGGGNTGGGEGLRLRLSRSSKLYATGSRAAKSSRTTVRLHALRKVKAGKYTLVVDVGEDVMPAPHAPAMTPRIVGP